MKEVLCQFREPGIKLMVSALLLQQIVVVSTFDNFPLLQDHNGLGIADCREPVGDDEDCPACHKTIHTLFNELFRPGIDRAGGLVQNQDRRIGAGGTGNIEELPLPLAQAAAVAGEDGLITLGKVADEAVGSRQPGGGLYLFIRGVQAAVTDVVRQPTKAIFCPGLAKREMSWRIVRFSS